VNQAAIQFNRITKIYQDRQVALADVSFDVPIGSTVGLLGANGSGKSTAIGIALGLLTPSAGSVNVFGTRMTPRAKTMRQRLGFLSDDPSFPKDLNAIQYLTFVGKCFGLCRLEQKARIGTLLRTVGLTNDASRRIGGYSTGMKTRLGVAASLMNQPDMLFWDEPTAGLEPISRMQTLDLLEKFRGNKTVVLSSHILGDIDRVCDRLIILNKGQLLFNGPRADLENMLPHRLLDIRTHSYPAAFVPEVALRLNRKIFSQEPGRLRIELDAEDVVGEVVNDLLNLAGDHQVIITGINSIGRQLEDAYLKLITEDEFRGFESAST